MGKPGNPASSKSLFNVAEATQSFQSVNANRAWIAAGVVNRLSLLSTATIPLLSVNCISAFATIDPSPFVASQLIYTPLLVSTAPAPAPGQPLKLNFIPPAEKALSCGRYNTPPVPDIGLLGSMAKPVPPSASHPPRSGTFTSNNTFILVQLDWKLIPITASVKG